MGQKDTIGLIATKISKSSLFLEVTRTYTIDSPSMGIDQKDAYYTYPAVTTVDLYGCWWLSLLGVRGDQFVDGWLVIRQVDGGRVILGQRLF